MIVRDDKSGYSPFHGNCPVGPGNQFDRNLSQCLSESGDETHGYRPGIQSGTDTMRLVPGVTTALSLMTGRGNKERHVYGYALPPKIGQLAVHLRTDEMLAFFDDLAEDYANGRTKRHNGQGYQQIGTMHSWHVTNNTKESFLMQLCGTLGEDVVYAALVAHANKKTKGALSVVSFAGHQLGKTPKGRA